MASGSDIAEVADPHWGLAPRGARIEAGGPEFAFTLRHKREVWAQELSSIYKQAVGNQWSAARDIPWDNLPKLPEEVEAAVCQIMTFLTENEFAALYVPARFIPRIHPHYREVVEVLAVQIVDEARHAEAFTRRAEAGGSGLGTTAVSGQLSLQTLLEEPDFTTATFLLCVMGEGTFLTLLKFLEEHAPEAVTATLARLAHRDEARHVAFGMEHLRYVLEREPERRSLAGCRRGAPQSHACGDFRTQPVCSRCLDGPGRRRDLAPSDSRGRTPCGRTASRDGSRPARALAKPSIRRRGSPNPFLLPHQEFYVTRSGARAVIAERSQ